MNTSIQEWFDHQGWTPFAFQREVWNAYQNGESGLIYSSTGSGKTYAALLGEVGQYLDQAGSITADKPSTREEMEPCRLLWITPLRALAADTVEAIRKPIEELALPWSIEARTGDTAQSLKSKQNGQLPTVLITTPESLEIMISRPGHPRLLSTLRGVVVDEWHELLSTKRGVLTELALAHLKAFLPDLRIWGLSATLANLEEAMAALLGPGKQGKLVQGELKKEIVIDALLPDDIESFPWSGHFGTIMVPQVVQAIRESKSCIVFTNTRAQAEIWFQHILDAEPSWQSSIGLHHGSLELDRRREVEIALKDGDLRAVVSTSSLDLGVDFTPVDRVIQIGSPKGVARLLQRAGRSGHGPGRPSRVTCVPTHAMELVDIAAARSAALANEIEPRIPHKKPLDLLSQHLMTLAAGGGFSATGAMEELRGTYAFQGLTPTEWEQTIAFLKHGGRSLHAYDAFHKLHEEAGIFTITDEGLKRRHRMAIGTIVSETAITLTTVRNRTFGTVEEGFVARLKKGDCFIFAGKMLEFIQMKETRAIVREANGTSNIVPHWAGGRMPLSNELARSIRGKLDLAKHGICEDPEIACLAKVLEVQAEWSIIPGKEEFLIESLEDSEGHHLFLFPLEGRLVHEGLSALFAFRLARLSPTSLSLACNDYGFEILGPHRIEVNQALIETLLSTENLVDDLLSSLNATEMAKRQFREIARVSGLIFQGHPGMMKSVKQIQASSGLIFDVFKQFEPDHILLSQAEREVLESQFDLARMLAALKRLKGCRLIVTFPQQPTPFAMPIVVDRLRNSMSTESTAAKVDRLQLISRRSDSSSYRSRHRNRLGSIRK